MNLRRLKYFVSIVETGSLTQASEILHVAQPALSQQLITLEAEFRQKLVIRTQRGVVPTDAGQALYLHARLILRQVEQARLEVGNATDEVSGRASLGFVPGTAASTLAVPLLNALRERHPGVTLYLNEGMGATLHSQLLTGEIDLALLYGAHSAPGLAVQVLMHEHLYLVAPPNLDLGTKDVSLETICGLDLILPHPDSYLRRHIDQILASHGCSFPPVACIESPIPLAGAIQAGLGATVLPASTARVVAQASGAHLHRLASPEASVALSLCTGGHHLTEPAAAVRDVLETLTADLCED